jgi:hypothetical protein
VTNFFVKINFSDNIVLNNTLKAFMVLDDKVKFLKVEPSVFNVQPTIDHDSYENSEEYILTEIYTPVIYEGRKYDQLIYKKKIHGVCWKIGQLVLLILACMAIFPIFFTFQKLIRRIRTGEHDDKEIQNVLLSRKIPEQTNNLQSEIKPTDTKLTTKQKIGNEIKKIQNEVEKVAKNVVEKLDPKRKVKFSLFEAAQVALDIVVKNFLNNEDIQNKFNNNQKELIKYAKKHSGDLIKEVKISKELSEKEIGLLKINI